MYTIEVDSKSWTIRELVEMYRSNRLSMDIPIQRGVVWDTKARSLYIHSALLGILAVQPPFVFSRNISHREDDSALSSYSVLDGKQRLTTLIYYLNDEFKLAGLQNQPYVDDLDVTGLKFTALPSELMQRLLNTSLTCTVVTDPTSMQEDIIFSRLNNNKAMSTVDKIRPQCKATVSLVDFINNNPLIFTSMFGSKQLLKKPEFEIVLKMLMMLKGEQGLSSAQMLAFAKELSANVDLADLEFVCSRAYRLNTLMLEQYPDTPSFLKHKAVFLTLIPYINNKDTTDEQLLSCIHTIMTTRLSEFKTGSAHSPTIETIQSRRQIVNSCI